MTVDIDAVNGALTDACRKLGDTPLPDSFKGTINAAIYLAGTFIRTVDQHRKGPFSLVQLKALTVGANELWSGGRMAYRGYVLIAERAAVGGIMVRAERVS